MASTLDAIELTYPVRQSFTEALKRLNQKLNEEKAQWKFDTTDIIIRKLNSSDGQSLDALSFLDIIGSNENPTVGLSLRIHIDQVLLITEGPDGHEIRSRPITFTIPEVLKTQHPEIKNYLLQLESNVNLLSFSETSDRQIKRYLSGIAGDPTAVSNSYYRMLYFSSIVITTVGFGDIVPMTDRARLFVAIEAVSGIMLAGLFLNAIAKKASGQV